MFGKYSSASVNANTKLFKPTGLAKLLSGGNGLNLANNNHMTRNYPQAIDISSIAKKTLSIGSTTQKQTISYFDENKVDRKSPSGNYKKFTSDKTVDEETHKLRQEYK